MLIYVTVYEVWDIESYKDPAHWTESVRAFPSIEEARAEMPVEPGDEELPSLAPADRVFSCKSKETWTWIKSSCYEDDDSDQCVAYREARYSIYECRVEKES